MKLSEIDINTIRALTLEQKWEAACGGVVDDGATAEVALVLGGGPIRAIERALAAAKLYRDGRVKAIIPSGGVEWEHNGEVISEANLMARVLRENGVPDEAIILENEARTTKENIIYGTLQIIRNYKKIVDSVIVVTSVWHMKRGLALAKALFPGKIRVYAYPSYPDGNIEDWLKIEENQKLLTSGLGLLKKLVTFGDVEDVEVNYTV